MSRATVFVIPWLYHGQPDYGDGDDDGDDDDDDGGDGGGGDDEDGDDGGANYDGK